MQTVEFTVLMNLNSVSQSKRVRALNVKVFCASVDVVHVVDLNSNCKLNVYVYCTYVCYKLEVTFEYMVACDSAVAVFNSLKLNVSSHSANDPDDFLISQQVT